MSRKTEGNYAYYEPIEALKIRIKAHKEYSQFSLEEYLTNNFEYQGKSILDMGCGNGNFTGILSRDAGLYVGIDTNAASLAEARRNFKGCRNVVFFRQDMDAELFIPDETVDFAFFVFSVYYTNDASRLFQTMHGILKPGGRLVLIGPTKNNASEVDDFCARMFGANAPSEARARRIQDEFPSTLEAIDFHLTMSSVRFDLTFPSYERYLHYLQATLQYRESFNGSLDESLAKKAIEDDYGLKLTKEITVLCAER